MTKRAIMIRWQWCFDYSTQQLINDAYNNLNNDDESDNDGSVTDDADDEMLALVAL